MNIAKEVKEIEKIWGVEAWNRILNVLAKMHERIKDLEKSRENWKKKYYDLKNENN